MGYFPFFAEISGKRVLIVGNGPVANRKRNALLPFGAEVTVLDRPFAPGDLEGAYLALAAADDPAVNAAAGEEARSQGILFNRSDCPADCDFFFPAICEGAGLVAGVVGDGTDHRRTAQAAKRIREVL